MSLPNSVDDALHQIAGWRGSLGPSERYILWLGAGIIGLLVWAWVSHRVIRWLAGHKKLRGSWYSPQRYHQLMQMLHEDQAAGRRVLSFEEIAALRKYLYGNKVRDIGLHRSTGYFS
jgi:hypothetical protein